MSSDVSTNVTEWPVAAATLQEKNCREQSGNNNQQDSQIRYTHIKYDYISQRYLAHEHFASPGGRQG